MTSPSTRLWAWRAARAPGTACCSTFVTRPTRGASPVGRPPSGAGGGREGRREAGGRRGRRGWRRRLGLRRGGGAGCGGQERGRGGEPGTLAQQPRRGRENAGTRNSARQTSEQLP